MTATNPDDVAARLRAGLEKERVIYEQLLDFTRAQPEVLLGGRTDEILELAHRKQKELGRIEEIESELLPLKEQWPRLKERLEPSRRKTVDDVLGALQDVLERLIDLEVSGQREVERRRQETSHRLRRAEGWRRLQSAYAPGESPPRSLDRSR